MNWAKTFCNKGKPYITSGYFWTFFNFNPHAHYVSKNGHIPDPATQSFCWNNLGMAPWQKKSYLTFWLMPPNFYSVPKRFWAYLQIWHNYLYVYFLLKDPYFTCNPKINQQVETDSPNQFSKSNIRDFNKNWNECLNQVRK